MKSFFDHWWVQGILFPCIIGIPLSIWTALVTSRYIEFNTVMRQAWTSVFERKVSYIINCGRSTDVAEADMLRLRAKGLGLAAALDHLGQINAGEALIKDDQLELLDFEMFREAIVQQPGKDDVERTIGRFENKVDDRIALLCRIRPEVWPLLFGYAVPWRTPLMRRSDCANCCDNCNRQV